ncbi:MAG TPA: hypothetical protein VHP11_16620 [Tepidisphaeraceae bacterium]|nr:hypothetical protein [Tepidisphaeraceae bacterium]
MSLSQIQIPIAVLFILLAILIASIAIFWFLVRRWTAQQHWLALSDWAEANNFKLHGESRAIAPDILHRLGPTPPRVLVSLHDPDTAILQIETAPTAPGAQPPRWNLLIRKLAAHTWPLTILRPAAHVHSLLDFFPLNTLQAMVPGERFIQYAERNLAGQMLSQSTVRALLPPDIGLVLVEDDLLLDFSTRPFDPLELQRIDALAEQIVARLPDLPQD